MAGAIGGLFAVDDGGTDNGGGGGTATKLPGPGGSFGFGLPG
jgi:hypothetical protein